MKKLEDFKAEKIEIKNIFGGKATSLQSGTCTTFVNNSNGATGGDTWYDDNGDGVLNSGDTIVHDDGTQVCP